MRTTIPYHMTFGILMLTAIPAMAQTAEVLPPTDGDSGTAVILDQEIKDSEWVDGNHREVKDRLQRTAHRIDGWFGSTDPNDPANASLRVMMDTTWNDYDGTTIKPRVRGKIKLPTLENRLSLVFGDDSLDDQSHHSDVLNEGRVAASNAEDRRFDRRQIRENNSSLALRWSKFRRATGIDVDLGARSKDIFIRAKIEKSWQIPHDIQVRAEQMYRYGSSSEHSALTTLEFTQPQSMSRRIVSRSHLYYTHKHEENLNWNSSLFQQHTLPVKHGTADLSYGIYTGGNIVAKTANLNSYGPYISYRQPLWRDWFFLQGDISYYNNKLIDRDHHVAIFSRAEVVF